MQTHTITTFDFSELSTEAQAKAIQTAQERPYNGDHEGPEAWDTADAFNDLNPPRTIVSLCRREPATKYGCSEWEESPCEQEAPEGHRAWVWLLHWVHDSFNGVDQYPTQSDVPPISVGMDWRKACAALESCPLTGVFYDCEVLDPIRKALLGNPRACPDIDSIFAECGESLQIALETAIEWASSEACIWEQLENGDAEYLESGAVYA